MENKSRLHKQGIRSKYLGYRDALEAKDEKTLTALLEAGKQRKEEVDG